MKIITSGPLIIFDDWTNLTEITIVYIICSSFRLLILGFSGWKLVKTAASGSVSLLFISNWIVKFSDSHTYCVNALYICDDCYPRQK